MQFALEFSKQDVTWIKSLPAFRLQIKMSGRSEVEDVKWTGCGVAEDVWWAKI